MSSKTSSMLRLLLTIAILAAIAGGGYWLYREQHEKSASVVASQSTTTALPRLVDTVSGAKHTVRFVNDEAVSRLGVRIDSVNKSPPPQILRLPGTLQLDANRLVHVHSRFPGELVEIGEFQEQGNRRPLRYGDRVTKGQLLAKVWSKEIGEKKSELVDALSRLDINRALLEKLESVTKGIVAERQVMEARRDVESDTINVTRIERTLRSWRLSDSEIDSVKNEAKLIKESKQNDANVSRRWAETEVRSPMDGVIVEKNFNVGDIIESADDLFKVADMSRLQVLVNVYEEDIWALRALPAEKRRWEIDLKSDPQASAIRGSFELIGSVIDPAQRTGVLIGWLDNPNGTFVAGQFITATIELPADNSLLAIPESSLVEEGGSSAIFVQTEPLTFRRCSVDVVRRMEGVVLIRKEKKAASNDDASLPGEKVVVSGVIGLAGELSNLEAQSVQ